MIGAEVDAHGGEVCQTGPVAGVDGVRGGWVIARVRSGRVSWAVVPDAATVLAATAGCRAVGVDVPIGLPSTGRRGCDEVARRRLGRAGGSVFHAPVRAVLGAADYAEACDISREINGAAIFRASWNITAGIRQWDDVELPDHVVEVHPELSFRALAPEVAFASKKITRGVEQRRDALRSVLPLPDPLAELPDGAKVDDVLDALAVAWSAARWVEGRAEVLGGDLDERGRPMRVVI